MISPVESHLELDVPNQISDEGLVLACRRGDANAWSLLVNRYQRLIYTIARRSGLDEDQAAEVFQSTFTSLLQHLNRIDQPDRIRAWLVTTSRRETLRMLRKQSAELSFSDTDPSSEGSANEAMPDDSPLPNEELERIEEQNIIRIALSALDERCQKLISMLFYRPVPVPYAEVAEALHIPESSLGPTRARCLQKMRRLLTGLYS